MCTINQARLTASCIVDLGMQAVQRGRSQSNPAPHCRHGPFKPVTVLPQESFLPNFVVLVLAVIFHLGTAIVAENRVKLATVPLKI